jgi:metal-dependent amidase/aminoacylase/carboxypeptidase family protein
MWTQELMDRLDAKEERIIGIRRFLHAHPELSFRSSTLMNGAC